MKARLAIIVNALLMAFAALMIGTNSIIAHRPETPMELLKK